MLPCAYDAMHAPPRGRYCVPAVSLSHSAPRSQCTFCNIALSPPSVSTCVYSHREHRRAAALVRDAHTLRIQLPSTALVAVVRGLLLPSLPQRGHHLRQAHHHRCDGARRHEHAARTRAAAQSRTPSRAAPGAPPALAAQDVQHLHALGDSTREHEAGPAGLVLARRRKPGRAHVLRRNVGALQRHLGRGRDQAVAAVDLHVVDGQGADGRGEARQAAVAEAELDEGGHGGGAQEGVDERRHALVAQLRVAVEPHHRQPRQGADARGDARQATAGEVEPLECAVAGQGVDERRRALVAQRAVVVHAEHLQAGHRGQRPRQRARPARPQAAVV
eukprot:scaffold4215_cov551-Prasinococcus_capsulatus_cf.AAC.2